MRNYPVDSPRAAARVLALTLIADGGVSEQELNSLTGLTDAQAMGIEPGLMDEVLQHLCEDLEMVSRRRWGRELDPAQVDPLLDEVRDPKLRGRVLQLAFTIAQADGRLSDGEGRLISHMNRRWQPEAWAIAA